MKILAVDDDETILEILSAVLKAGGHADTKLATSGRNAMELINAEAEPFDCILSDIQMPEMDGIALGREIRATPGYESVPIIMVTAMSDRTYVDGAFEAGATDFVTKPFDILELNTRINLVEKLIYERKMVAEGVDAFEALKEKVVGHQIKDFDEPVALLEGERVLSNQAFENYLTQLTRLSLFQSSLFAVKVAGLEMQFKTVSGPEFQRIVTRVALAISNALRIECSFLAYRGSGIFVCIDHNSSGHSHRECEANLSDPETYATIAVKYGLPADLEFFVGEMVPLSVFIKSGNIKYLQRAVDIVEAKHVYVLGKQTKEGIPQAKAEALQQPYKSLLDDCLKDGLSPVIQ